MSCSVSISIEAKTLTRPLHPQSTTNCSTMFYYNFDVLRLIATPVFAVCFCLHSPPQLGQHAVPTVQIWLAPGSLSLAASCHPHLGASNAECCEQLNTARGGKSWRGCIVGVHDSLKPAGSVSCASCALNLCPWPLVQCCSALARMHETGIGGPKYSGPDLRNGQAKKSSGNPRLLPPNGFLQIFLKVMLEKLPNSFSIQCQPIFMSNSRTFWAGKFRKTCTATII